MKTLRYILALALLVAPRALAQVAGQPDITTPVISPPVTIAATVTPPPCVKNTSFYAAGASFNRAATPNLAGLFAIGVPLTCSTNQFQVYSYTEHNIVPVGSGNNLTFKDTTSTGFATPLKQVGPFYIFIFGNVGIATTTSTATSGASASVAGVYGAMAVFPLWKSTAWRGMVAAQKVDSNNIYSILFGRSW